MNRPASIAEIARRAAEGTQRFDPAVREFLDEWQIFMRSERVAAIDAEPRQIGKVHDAYLAALAEHLALSERIDVPQWSEAEERFLSEPFFSGGMQSLKAALLVESPLAFRRRLIFISANALSRPNRVMAENND